MRIDPQISASENSGINRVADSQFGPSKSASTSASTGPNDTVDLSSGQATVRQLVSQIVQVPDTRQDRVNALKLQIQSGQYKPTNSQVAGAIISQQPGVNFK
jgi:flagellar biosynthesis anti-sigma factor FlgM